MTKQHILPVHEPLLKAYLHIGMPFSILPDEFVENGWVYNTYTQLVYYNENPEDPFMDFTQVRFWEDVGIFTKGFMDYPARTEKERVHMVEEIKRFMEKGYYIWGDWDEYWIPDTPAYRGSFYRHYFMAYGYDENGIWVEGYLDDEHWHRFQVSENTFGKALLADADRDKNGLIGINVYRPKDAKRYSFDYEKVRKEMYDYLESKGEHSHLPYGMNAIRSFAQDIKDAMQNGGDYPIQSVYIVYEHKLMMEKRLQYMYSHKIGRCDDGLLSEYSSVKDAFYSVVCSCVKYNMTGRKSLGEKVYQKMIGALEREEKVLRGVFE